MDTEKKSIKSQPNYDPNDCTKAPDLFHYMIFILIVKAVSEYTLAAFTIHTFDVYGRDSLLKSILIIQTL